eukprot:TRINITY_DN448_c0_g2_i1.p1 TRINITY_DN448_c0_g2~~TRINITY_DN448_c0_g2_i1.p1  ORF type:complete len:238 (+),score=55.36 TRINITY_DN448_c0_g2_i1:68-715(+)
MFDMVKLPMDSNVEVQTWMLIAMLLEVVQFALHTDFVVGDIPVPSGVYPYVNTLRLTVRGVFDLATMFATYCIMVGVHDFTWYETAFVGFNSLTHFFYLVMYLLPIRQPRDFFYHSVALSFALFTKYPMKPGNTTTGYSLNADGTVSFVKEWAFVPFMANILAYTDFLTHVYFVSLIAGYMDLYVLLPVAVLSAYLAGQRVTRFYEKVRKLKNSA